MNTSVINKYIWLNCAILHWIIGEYISFISEFIHLCTVHIYHLHLFNAVYIFIIHISSIYNLFCAVYIFIYVSFTFSHFNYDFDTGDLKSV